MATPQRNSTTRRICQETTGVRVRDRGDLCLGGWRAGAKRRGEIHRRYLGGTGGSSYESDPDVATLTFLISAQDKEWKPTYGRASESMRRIAALAEKNGLPKADVSSGALAVRPYYEGAKRKKAKS